MSKKIVRVAVRGIDTNSSLDRVHDGAFEMMHNTRFTQSGGCRSVGEFETEREIKIGNDFTIAYKHPSLPPNQYIATKENSICLIEIVDGEILQRDQLIELEQVFESCKSEYFAYGNILYITLFKSHQAVEQFSFIYEKERFTSIDFNKISPPKPSKITYERVTSGNTIFHIPSMIAKVTLSKNNNGADFSVESYEKKYLEIIDDFIRSDYIYGTQFLLFSYKLFDGTIIKNSRIYQMDCEMEAKAMENSLYYKKENDDLTISFYKILNAIKPTITFDAPQEVLDNPLIESILIYSTRNYPIYKLDNLYHDVDFNDSTSKKVILPVWGEVTNLSSRSIVDKINYDTPKGIFYEIAELKFREESSIELNYTTHYTNIEQMPLFVPTMSLHKILSNGKFEYNARLHIYNFITDYFDGEAILRTEQEIQISNSVYKRDNTTTGRAVFRYKILSGMKSIVREKSIVAPLYKKYTDNSLQEGIYLIIPNLLTYQDANAKNLTIFFENQNGERFLLKEFALKSAYANHYAYFQNTNIDRLFSHYPIAITQSTPSQKEFERESTEFSNRLMVSNIDNPFVYNPKNVISVSNSQTTICSMNIAMDLFTENGFGVFPLYLFTDKGIYALQCGSGDVLYSNQVKINNDTILKGSKTISAMERIYFCTPKGLSSIQGRNSISHSENLEKLLTDKISFVEYIKGSALYFMPLYNELILHNNLYPFAVVYSILSKGFYTRDFSGNAIDHEHLLSENRIVSLLAMEREDRKLSAELCSRALKLDSMEYKRVSKVIVRGKKSSFFNLKLFGSNDANQWHHLSECGSNNQIRRTSTSWRYFKVALYDKDLDLDFIDFEYNERFINGLK